MNLAGIILYAFELLRGWFIWNSCGGRLLPWSNTLPHTALSCAELLSTDFITFLGKQYLNTHLSQNPIFIVNALNL